MAVAVAVALELAVHLVELNDIAARIGYKGLAIASDLERVAHLEAPGPQLANELREIGDLEGEVLAKVWWCGRFNEVDLLFAHVDPGARHPKVRAVGACHSPECLRVEGERRINVWDIQRHVMNPDRLH